MEATTTGHRGPAGVWRGLAGWSLVAAGAAGVSWWIWTWSKVEGLIADHVAAHGPLPTSPMERALLYVNGTLAEQQLSSDLEDLPGLYPWGGMPLILAALAVFVGWSLAVPRTRKAVAAGIGASALVLAVPLILLGEPMLVALDILE